MPINGDDLNIIITECEMYNISDCSKPLSTIYKQEQLFFFNNKVKRLGRNSFVSELSHTVKLHLQVAKHH